MPYLKLNVPPTYLNGTHDGCGDGFVQSIRPSVPTAFLNMKMKLCMDESHTASLPERHQLSAGSPGVWNRSLLFQCSRRQMLSRTEVRAVPKPSLSLCLG